MAKTPEQQLSELQSLVTVLQTQLLDLSKIFDHSSLEVQQLRDNIAQGAWSAGNSGGGKPQQIRLLDPKTSQPDKFAGDRMKISEWIEQMMAFANSMAPGFRRALVWAMGRSEVIDFEALNELDWEPVAQADAALYDMLMVLTRGEPQAMVKNAEGNECGFEAWRVITQFYDLVNANNAIDIMNHLTNVRRCKKFEDVNAAINNWESEWAKYINRTNVKIPEEIRANILLKILPVDMEHEMRTRYVQKGMTYPQLRNDVSNWIQLNVKSVIGMHIGTLTEEDHEEALLALRQAKSGSTDKPKLLGK